MQQGLLLAVRWWTVAGLEQHRQQRWWWGQQRQQGDKAIEGRWMWKQRQQQRQWRQSQMQRRGVGRGYGWSKSGERPVVKATVAATGEAMAGVAVAKMAETTQRRRRRPIWRLCQSWRRQRWQTQCEGRDNDYGRSGGCGGNADATRRQQQ